MNDKLRQLQLCELEILQEFVQVCEKHSLQYFLTGGTLLGAVRHKGFIPWDDDIDVAMPRMDYERLLKIYMTELDSRFFYQTPESDAGYFLGYAKLRKRGTIAYEERFKYAKFHKGVFIDIFPLDYCPKPGLWSHLLFNILAVMNYRGQVDSGEAYKPYKELVGKIGYTVLRLFSKKGIVRLRKMLIALSNRLSSKNYVVIYSGAYGYRKEIMPQEWYFGENRIVFENSIFSVPANPEMLLKHVYGEDCLNIPSEIECRLHIDLEKSYF